MQQHIAHTDIASAVSRYFTKAHLPTQQETSGEIVTGILKNGQNLNREPLYTKFPCRLEKASGEKEQEHYNVLIGLFFKQSKPLIYRGKQWRGYEENW